MKLREDGTLEEITKEEHESLKTKDSLAYFGALCMQKKGLLKIIEEVKA